MQLTEADKKAIAEYLTPELNEQFREEHYSFNGTYEDADWRLLEAMVIDLSLESVDYEEVETEFYKYWRY